MQGRERFAPPTPAAASQGSALDKLGMANALFSGVTQASSLIGQPGFQPELPPGKMPADDTGWKPVLRAAGNANCMDTA